jgi:hypothetical protein
LAAWQYDGLLEDAPESADGTWSTAFLGFVAAGVIDVHAKDSDFN